MEIHLADRSSGLFLLDILSCGRTAYEEPFSYRRFSSRIQIFRGDRLIYRDNTRYEPEKMPMKGLGMYEGYTHLANLFLSAPDGADGGQQEKNMIDAIWNILEEESDCEGGVTRLAQEDLAIRIFGRRAQILQNIAENIKGVFER